MARLPGVAPERAGWLVRALYRAAKRMVGQVPEPMTIQAHHGGVLGAVAAAEFFFARGHRVSARLKTLASL